MRLLVVKYESWGGEIGTTEQVLVRAAENSGGNRGGLFEVQMENPEAMLRNVKEFPF